MVGIPIMLAATGRMGDHRGRGGCQPRAESGAKPLFVQNSLYWIRGGSVPFLSDGTNFSPWTNKNRPKEKKKKDKKKTTPLESNYPSPGGCFKGLGGFCPRN